MVDVTKPLHFVLPAALFTVMAVVRDNFFLAMSDAEQLLGVGVMDCVVQGQWNIALEAFEARPVDVPKVSGVVELDHGERGRNVHDRLLAVEATWFHRHFNKFYSIRFLDVCLKNLFLQ